MSPEMILGLNRKAFHMTDLVERLMDAATTGYLSARARLFITEAADEITRLRSDIEDLVKAASDEATENASLRRKLALHEEKLPTPPPFVDNSHGPSKPYGECSADWP